LLARQASAGAGLCNAAVTFFPILSFFLLFNDRLEQRDLGNYKTDLHQIFRVVDMLAHMFNLILVSALVKGRCHGNQF